MFSTSMVYALRSWRDQEKPSKHWKEDREIGKGHTSSKSKITYKKVDVGIKITQYTRHIFFSF